MALLEGRPQGGPQQERAGAGPGRQGGPEGGPGRARLLPVRPPRARGQGGFCCSFHQPLRVACKMPSNGLAQRQVCVWGGGRVWCKMSSLLGQQVDPWTWPAEEKDAWSSDSRARPRLAPWLRVRRGRTARVQILTFLGLPASVRRSHMPPFRYLQHRGDPRN